MKRALAAAAALVMLAGCGGSPPVVTVADQVPALGERLERIDAALVDQRYVEARRALRALVADTKDAEAAGDLDPDLAARILAAAKKLLALLPKPGEPEPDETFAPEESPSEEPSRKPSAPATTATPDVEPEEPEPSAPATEEPVDPTPSEEPTTEPSREATPTEQASPASLE